MEPNRLGINLRLPASINPDSPLHRRDTIGELRRLLAQTPRISAQMILRRALVNILRNPYVIAVLAIVIIMVARTVKRSLLHWFAIMQRESNFQWVKSASPRSTAMGLLQINRPTLEMLKNNVTTYAQPLLDMEARIAPFLLDGDAKRPFAQVLGEAFDVDKYATSPLSSAAFTSLLILDGERVSQRVAGWSDIRQEWVFRSLVPPAMVARLKTAYPDLLTTEEGGNQLLRTLYVTNGRNWWKGGPIDYPERPRLDFEVYKGFKPNTAQILQVLGADDELVNLVSEKPTQSNTSAS